MKNHILDHIEKQNFSIIGDNIGIDNINFDWFFSTKDGYKNLPII